MEFQKPLALDLGWQSIALLALLIWYFSHRGNSVYLVDFTTFKPPEDWKITPEQTLQCMRDTNSFSEESLDFMDRMLKQSGVGPATAWPPGIVQTLKGAKLDESVEASRKESEVCCRLHHLYHFLFCLKMTFSIDCDVRLRPKIA